MSVQADALPPSSADAVAPVPPALSPARPFYWLVRRELWENKSLYVAPLAAAGLVLAGFLISMGALPKALGAFAVVEASQNGALAAPFAFAGLVVMAAGFLAGLFYCLGALHNERRDRSILFWKSMPLSDLLTVASKAIIPFVAAPLIAFVVIVALHLVMLIVEGAAFLVFGLNLSTLWTSLDLPARELVLLYSVVTLAIWYAPIYGWLMLVSGWARRVTFLWAILPPIGLCVFEQLAFHTNHLASLLGHRLTGATAAAFAAPSAGEFLQRMLPQIDPVGFLSRPDVWIGLIIGAGFLAAAVWLRRYREPI